MCGNPELKKDSRIRQNKNLFLRKLLRDIKEVGTLLIIYTNILKNVKEDKF